PPAQATRNTVLGQYQDHVTPTICASTTTALNSLYQYVIGASDQPITWANHPGGPEPLILLSRPPGFVLPGIGNGPSATLTALPAWSASLPRRARACAPLALQPGAESTWLSGIAPSVPPADRLRAVLDTHRQLVAAAATPADRFWASYPF